MTCRSPGCLSTTSQLMVVLPVLTSMLKIRKFGSSQGKGIRPQELSRCPVERKYSCGEILKSYRRDYNAAVQVKCRLNCEVKYENCTRDLAFDSHPRAGLRACLCPVGEGPCRRNSAGTRTCLGYGKLRMAPSMC